MTISKGRPGYKYSEDTYEIHSFHPGNFTDAELSKFLDEIIALFGKDQTADVISSEKALITKLKGIMKNFPELKNSEKLQNVLAILKSIQKGEASLTSDQISAIRQTLGSMFRYTRGVAAYNNQLYQQQLTIENQLYAQHQALQQQAFDNSLGGKIINTVGAASSVMMFSLYGALLGGIGDALLGGSLAADTAAADAATTATTVTRTAGGAYKFLDGTSYFRGVLYGSDSASQAALRLDQEELFGAPRGVLPIR